MEFVFRVKKKSGKPFKSGRQINTVVGEAINPYTNKPAYKFLEDDSLVNQDICEVVSEETPKVTAIPREE